MLVLRILVRLLPRDFRREYGDELLQTVDTQWRAEGATLPWLGRMRFWLRQWWALIQAAVTLRAGGRLLGEADRAAAVRGRHFEMGTNVLTGMGNDLRHALRGLVTRPGFSLVAVLTLGLGVGATATMFSAVNAVLLRPLPYQDAAEVVVLRQLDTRDGSLHEGVSAANLYDVAAASQTLASASFAEAHGLRWLADGRAISLRSWAVSAGFFEAIGTTPQLGRAFLPDEYQPGGGRVVLVSHWTWQSRFGGDLRILGRELILDGAVHQVVGVLPGDFQYPSAAEIWAPRPPQPGDAGRRAVANTHAIGRVAPGFTRVQAQRELDRVAADLAAVDPEANANMALRAIPLREHLLGDVATPLQMLLGAVFLVLMIAAANVAGLQLARGASRSREIALRGALGASSHRLLRLVVLESLLLAAAAALLGVGLAQLGTSLVRMLAPASIPRIEALRIDGTVLAFALLVAVASALAAGIVPAWRAVRPSLQATLAAGSRGSTRGSGAGRLRDRLVIAEIALALMLLVGAGLLVRSFDQVLSNDIGFETAHRLAVQVWAYDENHRPQVEFFAQSVEKITALPGVRAVGLTTSLPLADDQSILSRRRMARFTVEGDAVGEGGTMPVAQLAAIDAGYPRALGVVLRMGRIFGPQDHARSTPVVLVNEAFVRHHLAGGEPLGRRLHLPDLKVPAVTKTAMEGPETRGAVREIVGVLADVRRHGFESEPQPEIYVSIAQAPSAGLTFVIETAGPPAELLRPVQEALRGVDPSQAIWAARPLEELVRERTRHRSFTLALLLSFAGLALTLAAVGIYGLMAFSVAQRTNELGIRRALGGQTADILGLVMQRGLRLAAIGIGLGLVGAVGLARLLRGMLFGVAPLDPITFVTLPLLVLAVAALATFLPAHKASRVEPTVALRAD